jgi:hypothetical protein
MTVETHRQDLVGVSISFMQTVTEIYGAERGQELWTAIADTIDPDLKGEVFMAMLTGNYRTDRLHVRNPFVSPVQNKVAVIRCIRTYDRRRLSLKEAKDIADRLDDGGSDFLEVEPNIRPTFSVELRKLGLVV